MLVKTIPQSLRRLDDTAAVLGMRKAIHNRFLRIGDPKGACPEQSEGSRTDLLRLDSKELALGKRDKAVRDAVNPQRLFLFRRCHKDDVGELLGQAVIVERRPIADVTRLNQLHRYQKLMLADYLLICGCGLKQEFALLQSLNVSLAHKRMQEFVGG